MSFRRPKEKCLKREGKCVNPRFSARPLRQKARIDAARSELRGKSVNRLTGSTSPKQICQRCHGCRTGSRAPLIRPCNASARSPSVDRPAAVVARSCGPNPNRVGGSASIGRAHSRRVDRRKSVSNARVNVSIRDSAHAPYVRKRGLTRPAASCEAKVSIA